MHSYLRTVFLEGRGRAGNSSCRAGGASAGQGGFNDDPWPIKHAVHTIDCVRAWAWRTCEYCIELSPIIKRVISNNAADRKGAPATQTADASETRTNCQRALRRLAVRFPGWHWRHALDAVAYVSQLWQKIPVNNFLCV